MTLSPRVERLREKYTGAMAENYERVRTSQSRWHKEQACVARFLRELDLPADQVVLDVPIGTGRFVDDYERHDLRVLGLDVSLDMLERSQTRIRNRNMSSSMLAKGDIMSLTVRDSSVPLATCLRLLNWFKADEMCHAVSELGRVVSRYAIIGIRLRTRRIVGGSEWIRHIPAGMRHRVRRLVHASRDDLSVVVHDEDEVLSAFESSRLTILDSVIADTLAERGFLTEWKAVYGFPKKVFLLEKV